MADTFPGVIAFAFMAMMLYLGALIRMRVPAVQRFLIPASIVGGAIGFVLINTGLSFGYTSDDFVAFTFHFFTLSFMSLVLTGSPAGHSSGTGYLRGGFWLAMLWTMSLVMQAMIGLGIVLAYNQTAADSVSPYLGMIVAHGFTQGPGQALALGSIWQTNFAIDNAASTGLVYASFGFVVSFLVGVPVARLIISRGLNNNKKAELAKEFLEGVYERAARPPSGRLITHPSNLESAAFHIGLLGLAYVLTYAWLSYVQTLLDGVTIGDVPVDLFVSFDLFFVHGLITCAIIRAVIDYFDWGQYIDDDTQRMITGTAVDLMVVGTLMSIKVAVVAALFVPIMLTTLLVTLATIALCFALSRTGGQYGYERALTSFGCCCGSTGTGLLLLRMLDPDFRTPVAKELAYFNIIILVTTAHILIGIAPILPGLNLWTVAAVYGATFVVAGVATQLVRPEARPEG